MAIHSAADLRISARLTSLLGSVSRNICAEKQQEVLGRASAQAHQTVSRCRKSRSGDIQRSHLAKATKIEDLAAAHQQDSSISPPAALLCIPTTADSIDGVLKVSKAGWCKYCLYLDFSIGIVHFLQNLYSCN